MKQLKRYLSLILVLVLVSSSTVYAMDSTLDVSETSGQAQQIDENQITEPQEDLQEGIQEESQQELEQAHPEQTLPETIQPKPKHALMIRRPSVDGGDIRVWTTEDKTEITYDENDQYIQMLETGTAFHMEITVHPGFSIESVTDERGNPVKAFSEKENIYTYSLTMAGEDKELVVSYEEEAFEENLPQLEPEIRKEADETEAAQEGDAQKKAPSGKIEVTFRANGGTGEDTKYMLQKEGDKFAMSLPEPGGIGIHYQGRIFAGWSENANGRGPNYVAGVEKKFTSSTTMYAIWIGGPVSQAETAYFYIRKDGGVQYEPSNYGADKYYPLGSATTLEGKVKTPVGVNNNREAVRANLLEIPSEEKIQKVLADNKVSYDPAHQEIYWYVIKSRTNAANRWNVDGVIVNKDQKMVSYNPNGGDTYVPEGLGYVPGTTVDVKFDKIPNRLGYTFLGWDENAHATEPAYTADGVKGFTMPDKNVTLYAIWRANNGTSFTVRHHFALEEGGYDVPQETTATATTGSTITTADYAKRDVLGYSFEKADPTTATVLGDGKTVVNLYYKLHRAKASMWFFNRTVPSARMITTEGKLSQTGKNQYEKQMTIFQKEGFSEQEIKEAADIAGTLSEEEDRYEYFDIYVLRNGNAPWIKIENWSEYDMQDGDEVRFHVVLEEPNGVKYVAGEHSKGSYTDKNVYRNETIPLALVSETGIEVETGYRFAGWKLVLGDASLTEDGQYKMGSRDVVFEAICERDETKTKEVSFTVRYYKGKELAAEDKKEKNIWIHDTKVPVEDGDVDTSDTRYMGYHFARTNPSKIPEFIEDQSVINVYFEPNEDTKYQVLAYYQKEGKYSKEADEIHEETGTTDTLVDTLAYRKSKNEHFIYDMDTSQPFEKGYVSGNGTLQLKVYFKELFTVTYVPGEQGDFTPFVREGLYYGDKTPQIDENNVKGKPGYTFAGWSPNIADSVTGNVEYVAQWQANTDTRFMVEHYQQQLDGKYMLMDADTETLAGITGMPVTASPKEYEGFYLDTQVKGSLLEGVITGDGSLVLKLFYTRSLYQYEIYYYYDNEINPEQTVKAEAKYAEEIVAETPPGAQKDGKSYVLVEGDYRLSISADEKENFIHVYYVLDEPDEPEIPEGPETPEGPDGPDGPPEEGGDTPLPPVVPGTPTVPAGPTAPAPNVTVPPVVNAPAAAQPIVTGIQTAAQPLAALAGNADMQTEIEVQELVSAEDEDVPLANANAKEHKCCILHFLLLLLALLVQIFYMRSMKKRQERIFELREEIALLEEELKYDNDNEERITG